MGRIWMGLTSELAHQEPGLVMGETASLASVFTPEAMGYSPESLHLLLFELSIGRRILPFPSIIRWSHSSFQDLLVMEMGV